MENPDQDTRPIEPRRVTLDHVAARVGVSRQTVSRVVNGKAEVKEATRARILKAIDELGYRPNLFARGLVTQRSNAIGLVVGDITNPYFPDVARGVQDLAEENGYNVFVCNFGGADGDELAALQALATQGADGCIFFSAGTRRAKLLEFAETYTPLVAINTNYAHPNITHVQADLYHGGAQVADHLISSGRRHLAVIGADYDYSQQLRTHGFCDRAVELGYELSEDARAFAAPSAEGGASAVQLLLERGTKFDAIFAFNDLVALGALRSLTEAGINVPADCAIVGCDDLELTEMISPTLTSIHMDRYRLGWIAMRHLLDRLADPTATHRPIVVPTTLITRQSSQPNLTTKPRHNPSKGKCL